MWTYIYCHLCDGYIGRTNEPDFLTYAYNHECKEA